MTAKQYLERLQAMSKRIDAKIEEKERLMAQATRATTVLSSMPKGSGGKQGFERFMDKVADMEASIVGEIDSLVDEKANTKAVIEMLANPEQREVLRLRYVEGKSLDLTAPLIPCGRTTVWRIEERAIDELSHIMLYYGMLEQMEQNNVINW